MHISPFAKAPMQCCDAEAAMRPSGNWLKAFFKCGEVGNNCVEMVGKTKMKPPSLKSLK